MRIKNIMLLLILLIFPMSLSIGNVSANESLEVEDIILEALNDDSELKVGFEEEVEKELEKLSNEELKLLVGNLNKKGKLSSEETTVLRFAEKSLESSADHSPVKSVIEENLSGDEVIRSELNSMDNNNRKKLYNNLKEKEDLSNEEKIILGILEKRYSLSLSPSTYALIAILFVVSLFLAKTLSHVRTWKLSQLIQKLGKLVGDNGFYWE